RFGSLALGAVGSALARFSGWLVESDDRRLRRRTCFAEYAGLELVRKIGDHRRAAVRVERRIGHPAHGRILQLRREAARLRETERSRGAVHAVQLATDRLDDLRRARDYGKLRRQPTEGRDRIRDRDPIPLT